MIEAYQKFKSAGFACLPTGPDKMPAIPKGSSWKGGWNNLKEYESSHGIAIICGKSSGNLECIDFDNSCGDIDKIWKDFLAIEDVKVITNKYAFPAQVTKRKGFHLIYRCDQIEGNQKLAERPIYELGDKLIEKRCLIETRGEGGYFCIDPTPGYKLGTNDVLKTPIITAEDRMILLSACRSFNEAVTHYKKQLPEETDKPGEIYNKSTEAIYEAKRELLSAGWCELKEGILRRPGKDRGISATFGKVAPGILYNFSSNGHPFENNRAYNPFQIVSLLKYGGDFSRFAKELYEKQNPDRPAKSSKEPIKPTPEKDPDQIYSELEKHFRVDLTAEPIPAPALLYLRNKDKLIPSVTLQNFSLVTGKAKSRKTFLTVLIVASYLGYINDLIKADSGRKGTVMVFDTEQSPYHLHRMMKRICELIGEDNPSRLQAYVLKTLTPEEKVKFIEYKIRTTPDIMMVVIDGIRDLVYDINSPEEATKTSVRLMKWCAEHNIHILNVLHQNKSDGNARGHLGSELTNKAETVLSVNHDGTISTVECEYSRELEFDTFSFIINDDSLPEICNTPEEEKTIRRIEPHFISTEKHRKILEQVFKDHQERKYKEAWTNIKLGFAEEGIYFGENKAKEYLAYYIKEKWVSYDEINKCYKYEKAIF